MRDLTCVKHYMHVSAQSTPYPQRGGWPRRAQRRERLAELQVEVHGARGGAGRAAHGLPRGRQRRARGHAGVWRPQVRRPARAAAEDLHLRRVGRRARRACPRGQAGGCAAAAWRRSRLATLAGHTTFVVSSFPASSAAHDARCHAGRSAPSRRHALYGRRC